MLWFVALGCLFLPLVPPVIAARFVSCAGPGLPSFSKHQVTCAVGGSCVRGAIFLEVKYKVSCLHFCSHHLKLSRL